MSQAHDAASFIVLRLFIGFSLAAFVCCQYWCTAMFSTRIVGSANAIAAGWGNMGGGVTHFLMPLIWQGIMNTGIPAFQAWRWAFFVPASLHTIMGMAILLFSQVRGRVWLWSGLGLRAAAAQRCTGGVACSIPTLCSHLHMQYCTPHLHVVNASLHVLLCLAP
jgi:hypothetical protein